MPIDRVGRLTVAQGASTQPAATATPIRKCSARWSPKKYERDLEGPPHLRELRLECSVPESGHLLEVLVRAERRARGRLGRAVDQLRALDRVVLPENRPRGRVHVCG